MNQKIKIVLVLLVCCLCFTQGKAYHVFSKDSSITETFVNYKVKNDDSTFKTHLPSNSAIDTIIDGDNAFHYKNYKPKGISLWDRFLLWLFKFLGRGIGKVFGVSSWVWYCLIFLLAVFVIVILIRKDVFKLMRGPQKLMQVEDIEENVHTLDFDKLIAENIALGRYRYAIRLYYLKTLKTLDAAGKISWAPQKTNREYADSMRKTPIYPDFVRITGIFNYAWYGELPVSEDSFRMAEKEFFNFNTKAGA